MQYWKESQVKYKEKKEQHYFKGKKCYNFSLFVVIELVLTFGTGQDNNRQQWNC
jgi:hypothetical protein